MRVFLFVTAFFSMIQAGFPTSQRVLVIHLNGEKVVSDNDGSFYDNSFPDTLNFYPEKQLHIKLKNKSVEMIVVSSSEKSDTGGLFYIRQKNGKKEIIDYAKVFDASVLADILLYDIDNDGINEVISYWVDEGAYVVKVDKILKGGRKVIQIFSSHPLTIPPHQAGKIVSVDAEGVIAIYEYLGKRKKGVITVNPCDPTREPYLKPLREKE